MDQQQILQLKDIHLPPAPGIWPLALGWWLLLVILLIFIVWMFFVSRKLLLIRKHKRMLLKEMTQLEQKLKDSPDKETITDTNILLRRIALAYYPEEKIASLTGANWLAFLDKSGGTTNFSQGAGRILIEAPYRSDQPENYNAKELISLVRLWVKRNARAKVNNQFIRFKRQNDKLAKKVGGCQL